MLRAQGRLLVGSTVEFGGIIASIDERGRQRLQQEIGKLYADRSSLASQLEQLRLLEPLVQPVLQKVSLPTDFRHLLLPFEPGSSYWNIPVFIQPELALTINERVDERYHPLVSTSAVAAYLGRLQQRKLNALRTLISYTQDPKQVESVERLTGSTTYAVLDADSPDIVWKVLARRLVFNYEEPAFRPNRTYLLRTYDGQAGQALSAVAFRYNVPTDRLLPFNKWLRSSTLPDPATQPVLVRLTPDEYATATVRPSNIPPANGRDGVDNGFPVLRRMPPQNSVLHTPLFLYEINSFPGIQAQPGDNIITLAFYGHMPVRKFLEYNEMTERDIVRPGEIYYLAPKAKRAKVPFHVAERGQTMRDIANMYGVRLKYLLKYNDIEANHRVAEGRVLWLQKRRPANMPVEYRQVIPRTATSPTDMEPSQPIEPLPDTTQLQSNPVVDQPIESVADEDTVETAVVTPRVPQATKPVAVEPAAKPATRLHKVAKGQTYYSISRLYGVTVNQLYQWNRLSERIPLEIGQELIVGYRPAANPARPTTDQAVRKPQAPARPARPADQGMIMRIEVETVPANRVPKPVRKPLFGRSYYYTVKPGQTVYRVALLNKVTVEDVMRWNNLRDYTIEVGQQLLIKK